MTPLERIGGGHGHAPSNLPDLSQEISQWNSDDYLNSYNQIMQDELYKVPYAVRTGYRAALQALYATKYFSYIGTTESCSPTFLSDNVADIESPYAFTSADPCGGE